MMGKSSIIKANHPSSYYAATAHELVDYPTLNDAIDCDICIIGGGFTGLSSALHLAEQGHQVVLLEAERIAWGASGRNGGQVGSGQRSDQIALEKELGLTHAQALWQLAEDAKNLVKHLVAKYHIACDLTPGTLFAAHKSSLMPWVFEYVEKLQRDYGYQHIQALDQYAVAERLDTQAYYGGWLDTDAAHLHPLNYALGLARAATGKGALLFEGSRVLNYSGKNSIIVNTAAGQVKTRYLILACNGYLGHLERRLAGKIMPISNFILATEPLSNHLANKIIRDSVAVYDSKFVINYYRRSADERLLFGGGETYSSRFPADLKAFVRRYMLKIYPQLADIRIDYAWGGTLAITLKRMPHVGHLQDNILFAHGYSGHGVALSTLMGQLITEVITGQRERFDLLANLTVPSFPGGRLLRRPSLVAGMLYYSLRDRW